jgi:uncharacterized membrane protein
MMSLDSVVLNFINKYYIEPIKLRSGYNIIQEVTYGILLFVMIYIFYKACNYLNIKIDYKFAITTMFYTVLIALIRAMVDAGIVPHSYYTVTPGIVVVIGLYYMMSIIITGYLFKNKYYIYSIALALMPIIYFIALLIEHIAHFEALIYVLILNAGSYLTAMYLINNIKSLKNRLNLNKIDKYAIFSQLTDASATAVGIAVYGYWEQHPIPRFLMDTFGAYIMIPLKLLVVLTVLYIVNEEVDNENLKNIIKITIMTLGLAPGLRDLFRTIMGV